MITSIDVILHFGFESLSRDNRQMTTIISWIKHKHNSDEKGLGVKKENFSYKRI